MRLDGPDEVGHASFEEMYRRDAHVLTALAASLTGSREQGADLAQEAMLRALREWTTVGRLERPGAWTRRVVVNLAIDAHRRVGREQHFSARLTSAMSARTDDVALAREQASRFWIAVRALPERQRAAVALHYIDDLSVAEVAEVLGIAPGTVKASLFSARRTLARRLRQEQQ